LPCTANAFRRRPTRFPQRLNQHKDPRRVQVLAHSSFQREAAVRLLLYSRGTLLSHEAKELLLSLDNLSDGCRFIFVGIGRHIFEGSKPPTRFPQRLNQHKDPRRVQVLAHSSFQREAAVRLLLYARGTLLSHGAKELLLSLDNLSDGCRFISVGIGRHILEGSKPCCGYGRVDG